MLSAAPALLAQLAKRPSPPSRPVEAERIRTRARPYVSLYGFGGFLGISDALLHVSASWRRWGATATVGAYAFPTVGFPLSNGAPTAGDSLYGPVPVAAVTYKLSSHLDMAVGKFGALLGQESPFTYQNLNIQRGVGWEMEPTISRGFRAAYVNGAWNASFEVNDAYYSGSHRAVEWLIGWSPSEKTTLQFAAIIPGSRVPGNATTAIGNKAEYDIMYSRRIGKLSLQPYLLLVHSPSSQVLHYTRAEDAAAQALLGSWRFSHRLSAAFRYERAWNWSSLHDVSPNADLVGFGPGRSVVTETFTPAYRTKSGITLRLEYSRATSAGGFSQTRTGFELGLM